MVTDVGPFFSSVSMVKLHEMVQPKGLESRILRVSNGLKGNSQADPQYEMACDKAPTPSAGQILLLYL